MLTCLNATSSTLPLVLENGCFCINVLRTGQTEISDIFSSRLAAHRAATSSTAVETETLVTGAPRLTAALVSFDCRLISAEKIGTHHICIGAVGRRDHGKDRRSAALRHAALPADRGSLAADRQGAFGGPPSRLAPGPAGSRR